MFVLHEALVANDTELSRNYSSICLKFANDIGVLAFFHSEVNTMYFSCAMCCAVSCGNV